MLFLVILVRKEVTGPGSSRIGFTEDGGRMRGQTETVLVC